MRVAKDKMVKENTLGLEDGLDIDGLATAIEDAFGTRFSGETIHTVGDIYDHVYKAITDGGEKCLSSMMFYRLRRALEPLATGAPLRPSTKLADIAISPKAFAKYVKSRGKIRADATENTTIGGIGALILVIAIASPLTLLFGLDGNIVAASAASLGVLGLGITSIDPHRFREPIQTLGDLTKHCVSRNYGLLVQQGGLTDEGSLWAALVDVIAPLAADLPRDEINRDTRITFRELTQ